MERELVKIKIFEVFWREGEQLEVLRGEAAPIVSYSRGGEKFKFYGGKSDNCLLFMKFKVDQKSIIDRMVIEEGKEEESEQ